MAMVTDPVCGMRIDRDDAVARAEHQGKPYYFCSRACHDAFIADAARRLSRVGMDPDHLTEDELAERSGTSGQWIWQLVDLGILQADDRGTFTRQDVMRARVVTDLHAMGIETEALATALASGHLTLGYLESAGRRHPRSDRTFAEVAKEIGVPFTTLERIYIAFGLLRPARDERVREEDLQKRHQDPSRSLRRRCGRGRSAPDGARLG